MQIRRACEKDLGGVHRLLSQVLTVHAEGRPDLFRAGTRKYTDDELLAMFVDDARPVFVAVDEKNGERVLGHAFCEVQDFRGSNNMQPILSIYVDDICVDEASRGQHVGTALYRHVLDFARELGCHNVTLNVWACNPGARAFYEAMGMSVQKTCLEQVL
ncbi:GNAT family N-acetyltransferase [Olsenella sp. An293]|uniref:GNAT family N-acetyltransferase n=1 Tax=Olsenella sp. An293 TaxID=1965626 RepID=UPI000B397FC1|nr:GNAT family N-acetyltransferase [Olsenella sp. An293]OUO32078.1 GNAT family N-acetyltransferase [Olsenella sp. An293]